MKNFATSFEQLSLPYSEYLDTTEPQMLIDDVIGLDENGRGLDCTLFARTLKTIDQLAEEKGYTRVCIMINSPGGSVEDGMGIYDAILNTKIPVDTYVTGRAASMAGVLFQAGRKRFMAEYSQLMLHNPLGTDNKKQLKAAKDSLIIMLARHRKITEEKIDILMNRESWILADEALELGLCDEVTEIKKLNNIDNKSLWMTLEKTTNQIKTEKQMKSIALNLGLPEKATEVEINAAIAALKITNKAKNDDEGMDDDDLKKTVNNLYKSHNDLKKSHADACDRITKLEDMASALKKATNSTTGTKIVALVAEGKIANNADAIATATALLDADFEAASKVFDSLPSKTVAAAAPANINNIIAAAAKEHTTNKEVVKGAVSDSETKTFDAFGNAIDLSKVKRPSVKDALRELQAEKK